MKNNRFQKTLQQLPMLILVISTISCSNNPGKGKPTIIFQDDFGTSSQGEYVENIIQLPPPDGLGFEWRVLPGGYTPVNWIHSDEVELTDPLKGFWVIPPNSGYLQQGGRSINSVLFANKPIPAGIKGFDITFRQNREDNDPIMYIIGADQPVLSKGFEFGYMTQVPGTDSTTADAYISGELGEKIVPNMALMFTWVDHLIKVRGDSVSWFKDDVLMAALVVPDKPKNGYFGILQQYERNTKYDDVKIVVWK